MSSRKLSEQELVKRRRERRVAVILFILFLASTIFQAFVSEQRNVYGVFQSLLYFGLLHLNATFFLLLFFLVSRNLVKAYLMRKSGTLGSSLRWKMVTSLVAFSLLPSLVLFLGSTYIIRQGFDQWFGGQVSSAIHDSAEIVKAHYEKIDTNLKLFSESLKRNYSKAENNLNENTLRDWIQNYPIAQINIYKSISERPYSIIRDRYVSLRFPQDPVENIQDVFDGKSFLMVNKFGNGDLVQSYFPLQNNGTIYAAVISDIVPLALKTRMNQLDDALTGYEKASSIKDSLKDHYTLVIATLFLLTLFVVSWFGLYVTKEVTEPVADLMKATDSIREGNWNYRIENINLKNGEYSGAPDLEILKSAFNLMAEEVANRGSKLENANVRLTDLVKELEEREQYLEILLSSIRRGVLVLDLDQKIERINKEALEFAHEKYKSVNNPFTLVGLEWTSVYRNFATDAEGESFLEKTRVMQGKPVDKIFELSYGIGRAEVTRSVRATGIFLKDANKNELGWMIILEDVSSAARMERLAAWQGVARRVAHEIKNPLTPIQISADRMKRRLDKQGEDPAKDHEIYTECLYQIQKQVRVIRDLVREFSQFAKMPEPKFDRVDLNNLLDELVKDYQFTHPDIEFILDNKSTYPKLFINADAEHMRALAVNLVDNAIQSMEELGNRSEKSKLKIEIFDAQEGRIGIVFEDNGPGIDSNMRNKIFDPYVSSKASGLGLGLAIVRRIAEEHRGRIRCEESPGGRFVLELPRLIEETDIQDV